MKLAWENVKPSMNLPASMVCRLMNQDVEPPQEIGAVQEDDDGRFLWTLSLPDGDAHMGHASSIKAAQRAAERLLPKADRDALRTSRRRRLTTITTRTGDNGTTGLADGTRRPKHDPLIHLIGELDELNAHLGVLAASLPQEGAPFEDMQELLYRVQNRLFDIGGELALPGSKVITERHVSELEQVIETINQDLPALENFVLPGGNAEAAACHLARAVTRRVERNYVALAFAGEVLNEQSQRYLNRLSDALFVMARRLAKFGGGQERIWQQHA
jgi:cob(I)alamin adenosyltransferase